MVPVDLIRDAWQDHFRDQTGSTDPSLSLPLVALHSSTSLNVGVRSFRCRRATYAASVGAKVTGHLESAELALEVVKAESSKDG